MPPPPLGKTQLSLLAKTADSDQFEQNAQADLCLLVYTYPQIIIYNVLFTRNLLPSTSEINFSFMLLGDHDTHKLSSQKMSQLILINPMWACLVYSLDSLK